VAEAITDEGTDVFTITRVNGLQFLTDFDAFLESLTNPDLTVDDRDYLQKEMEEARLVSAEVSRAGDLTARGNRYRSVNIRGVTEDYALLNELPLLLGRHLTRQDLLTRHQVVVLGYEVAEELFPRRADPVGQEVKLGGRHFKVIGVVEDRGTVMGNNRNQFAVVPITTFQKVFGSGQSIEIKVAAQDLGRMTEAQDEATFLMRLRHRRRPLERDDFAITTADQLLSIWGGISKAIYGALVPLVGISLVVGGIVLMNIMLVAVTERTREIGVRKALGAPRKAILWQFMVEAITLSMIGGVLGILIGMFIAFIIAALSPLTFAIAGWSVWLGLVVTFVIGGVFGTYPAWKAAGFDPVEALRHEG
jgi:putative ABC transport system permease protein